ncbi:hypothetical protein E2C01_081500 [Portunus trituberculatus]|uniref:Uncharacterized protein n=1 Tax=Portunus trituberculatus TaxID=210409 RepID=A0A5B7IWI4_PORTR|nr:hypothetical protein [Portunus trituberculatus]
MALSGTRCRRRQVMARERPVMDKQTARQEELDRISLQEKRPRAAVSFRRPEAAAVRLSHDEQRRGGAEEVIRGQPPAGAS